MEHNTYCQDCAYFQRYYTKSESKQSTTYTSLEYGDCAHEAIDEERHIMDQSCQLFAEKKKADSPSPYDPRTAKGC